MMKMKRLPAAMAGLLLAGATPFAQAALNAVDPAPYLEANGFFPEWYQDTNGRALELCLSPAVIAADPVRGLLGGAGCTLLPNPGIFDPALPMVFPTNFPDESFWFMGDAVFTSGGVNVTYVSALEAAFGGGDPAPDDQVSFARIRIRISLPGGFPGGGYTFIHPYGIETFDVAAGGGTKVINMTRDIGIGAPGDFTGALKGDIGPFLMDETVPTLGPIVATNGEQFVGDPNTLRPVVGSPFGTNFVRLIDPAGNVVAESDLFAVMGKVYPGALATPVAIERTTYTRTPVFAQQDVFVKAPPTSSSVTFDDAAGDLVLMTDDDANGGWYGQSPPVVSPPVAPSLPATIPVTANNPALNNAPTTVSSPLTDFVTITRAVYSAGSLTVDAVSSDRVATPALIVNDVTMASVGTSAVRTATLTGLTIPPARVTVTSANGGSDTEEVVLP